MCHTGAGRSVTGTTKKVENPITRRTLVRGAVLDAPAILGGTALAQAAPGQAFAIPKGDWIVAPWNMSQVRTTLDVPTPGGAVMESVGFNNEFRGAMTLVKQNLPLTPGQRYRFTFSVQSRLGGDPATNTNPAGWLDIMAGFFSARRFTSGPYPADYDDQTNPIEVIPPADWTQWGADGVAGRSKTVSSEFVYTDNAPFSPLNYDKFVHKPAALFVEKGFQGEPDKFRISVSAQQL